MGIDSTLNTERIVLNDINLASARQTVHEHATDAHDECELLAELGLEIPVISKEQQ